MEAKKRLKSLSELENLLPHDPGDTTAPSMPRSEDTHDGKGRLIHVTLDTKGRKGKIVTIISGLQHNPDTMRALSKILKQHCGAGGTVKEGNIEIQGDQRRQVGEKLQALNYVVGEKRGCR